MKKRYVILHIPSCFSDDTFTKLSVRETKLSSSQRAEAIISKVPLACPITKASNSSHFHFPLIFLFSAFPAMQYHISFFHTFSHLRNLKQCVHRGVTTPQVQQRVWSDQQS